MSASTKTVVVTGATGGQGGSVVDALLKDGSYKVRAVTRNATSAGAQALAKKGAEVVQADLNDINTLKKAFEGAYAIYAITDFFEPFFKSGPEAGEKIEFVQAKNLADAAAATPTLEHYIWSTLPSSVANSKGKWHIPHFEAKAAVDEYIINDLPSLASKTTFFWITFYATNLVFPNFSPNPIKSSGKYAWIVPMASSTPMTNIADHRHNVGVFTLAVLKNPEQTKNRYVLAETETTTAGEYIAKWAKATGNETIYVQVSLEAYDQLYPGLGQEMGSMMQYWEEYPQHWRKDGVEPVTRHELGIKSSDLISVEQVMASEKWTF